MDVKVTINGKRRYVRDRTTIFEACREAGYYVPHFCYHPKLSVPANCRMCLVQVEKVPKPVPSCATLVSDGMVIHTNSPPALAAQKGVMEFLLINHPLDCPICDQGGECQLQDLAVGYGNSCTRYGESKRVVVEKHLGPLITTVMTRCIHCTRCVRFGQEIAGDMELGMVGRGEHSEIMPFVENTVNSELSGNMIDICPVGALNSKPFRFSARTWELRRTNGVAQHDSWGSYIKLQSKDEVIKRVLPREHEEINECWISDRDRFAYTGINVPGRLVQPHVRDAGATKTRPVEWQEALEVTATLLSKVIKRHGAREVGMLLGPGVVSEEAILANQLLRGLGSGNIDHRLRQQDFSLDGHEKGVPWLGCSIEEIGARDHVLLIGADPARELPLLPVRLRRCIKERKTVVSAIGSRSLAKQVRLVAELLVPPSGWAGELAVLCQAVAGKAGNLPAWIAKLGAPDERHRQLAQKLQDSKAPMIFLGAEAYHASEYGLLRRLASLLASLIGGSHGLLVEGANSVGLALAGAVPHHGFMHRQEQHTGHNVKAMLETQLKAYILLGCEPLDFADAALAQNAFAQAVTISIGSYMDTAREYADTLLPAALFAERKGAMVNLEGNAVTMDAAVMPPGEARPAWKILRVLGNLLAVDGFEYEDIDQVRVKLIKAGNYTAALSNDLSLPSDSIEEPGHQDRTGVFERVLETAHYASDSMVRHAAPLQETEIARNSHRALFNQKDLVKLGVAAGDEVALASAGTSVTCVCGEDQQLMRGCVRAPWGVAPFTPLGVAATVRVAAVPVVQPLAASGGF